MYVQSIIYINTDLFEDDPKDWWEVKFAAKEIPT